MSWTPVQGRAIAYYEKSSGNKLVLPAAFPHIFFRKPDGTEEKRHITDLEIAYAGHMKAEQNRRAKERREAAKAEKAARGKR